MEDVRGGAPEAGSAVAMEQDRSGPAADLPASIADILSFVLRYRYVFVILCIIGVSMGIILAVSAPEVYTARMSFMPQGGNTSGGGLAGLAGQLGISLSFGDAGQSPDFYSDLLRSRAVLESVARTKYVIQVGSDDSNPSPVSLLDVFEITGGNEPSRVRRASSLLEERIETRIRTGVVEVAVTMPHPQLAAEVAGQLLDALHEFNSRTRQSQASAERRFLELRLKEVGEELHILEEAMRQFFERNRVFANSPQLVFEADRLQRQVNLREEVYIEIALAYEQARIAEVRDTPVLTVIEEARAPASPDSARLFLKAGAGLTLGMLFGLFWGALRDFLSEVQRGGSTGSRKLRALLDESSRDLGAFWRWVRRRGNSLPSDVRGPR